MAGLGQPVRGGVMSMQRRPDRLDRLALVGILVASSWTASAPAQTELPGASEGPASSIPGTMEGPGQPQADEGDIFKRTNLLGNIGGLRTFLGGYGITL